MYSISKMVLSLQLIICGLVILSTCNCLFKRQWDYTPLSIIATSSDESKLNISLRIQRLAREEYAISGTIDLKYDMDDTTMLHMTVFISQSGSGDDFAPTPFKIEKQSLVKSNELFYNDLVYKNFGNCSNLPKTEQALKSPFPKRLYTFNRCTVGDEGVPNIIPAGYYKIVCTVSGEVDWNIDILAKVTTKKRIF